VKALLDTNILAELVKPNGNLAVRAALAELPTANVFLSVLTVGEIVKGIALLAAGPKKNDYMILFGPVILLDHLGKLGVFGGQRSRFAWIARHNDHLRYSDDTAGRRISKCTNRPS
jgi:hypothetical protein